MASTSTYLETEGRSCRSSPFNFLMESLEISVDSHITGALGIRELHITVARLRVIFSTIQFLSARGPVVNSWLRIVMQSGFGVIFLFWPGELPGKLPANPNLSEI